MCKILTPIYCLGLLLLILLTACNQPPAVNPWIDDSIPAHTANTPSAKGLQTQEYQPRIRNNFNQANVPYVSQDVAHYPLWWEDPFEDQGDNNNTFAWTWQDYLAMPYGCGRYLLNTMLWPASAIVTPPGTSMVSDGTVPPQMPGLFQSHPHDARRGYSPNPTAYPTDFGYYQPYEPIAITESAPAP